MPARSIPLAALLAVALAGCDGFLPCTGADSSFHARDVWAFDVAGDDRSPLVSLDWTGDVSVLGTSADGARLYYATSREGRTLVARDLATGAETLADFGPGTSGLVLSPDGALAAFKRARREVWVAAVDGSGARLLAADSANYESPLVWVGSDRIAHAPGGRGVYVRPVDGGPARRVSSADSVVAFAVAPDERTVAFVRHGSRSDGSLKSVAAYACI